MASATQVRSVRIFRNGRSQAIRIPREFALTGDVAVISRDKNGRLILETSKQPSLSELLDSWGPLGEEDAMPKIDDATAERFEI